MGSTFAVSFDLDEPRRDRPASVHLYGAADGAVGVRIELIGHVVILSGHPAVVIDLSHLAFMDCAGYAALELMQRRLRAFGRAVTVRIGNGQPARLIAHLGIPVPVMLRPRG